MFCLIYWQWTYRRSCVIEGTHCNFEASTLSNQDVLLRYPHILKGDASGIRAPLAHVHLLQAQNKQKNVTLWSACRSVKLPDCTPEVELGANPARIETLVCREAT